MPNVNFKQRFIMLHSSKDNSVFGINVDEIVMFGADEENGRKCTTVYFDNDRRDITSCTVNETCEKMAKMLDLSQVPAIMLHSAKNNSVLCVALEYMQMFGKFGGSENGTELILSVQTDAESVYANESPEKVFKIIKDKLEPAASERQA